MLFNLGVLALAMLVLLLCEWLGYRLWIRQYEPAISWQGKGILGLMVLTLAGGFIGAFSWWFSVPDSFAWTPPPLASRMLGAAGWSFALLSLSTLSHPSYRRVRLYAWMLGVYMWPLTLAILLFHLDRFDFNAPITYAFFAVVVILNAIPIWCLIRQPEILTDEAVDRMQTGPSLRAWLTVVAVVTGLWSLALFITDSGPIQPLWTWPGDLLSSRLIGSMLLTICIGAIVSLPGLDTANVLLETTILYSFGLAIASLWNALVDKPVNLAYLVTFGLIGLGSVWMLVQNRMSMHRIAGTPSS